jgi:capsular exopolysaccharide synthesis family protein
LEPGEYLIAVRRRWPVVVAAVALAAALAWFTAPNSVPKPRYKATAIVSVRPTSGSSLAIDPITAEIVATQATSKEVVAKAQETLQLKGPPERLAAEVNATFEGKGNSVRISSTQADAESAVNVANAFTNALLAHLQQRQEAQVQAAVDTVNQSVSDLQKRSASLDQRLATTTDPAQQATLKSQRSAVARELSSALARLQQFDGLRGPGTSRTTLIRDAVAVQVANGVAPPSSSLVRAIIAAAVGLLIGAALAIFLDRLDPTLRTKSQAEAAFGLPVVSEIPRTRSGKDRVEVAVEPRSALAESYRTLRTATLFMPVARTVDSFAGNGAAERPEAHADANLPLMSLWPKSDSSPQPAGRLVVVTSPGPGEGKTAAAVNLAAAFAEAGKSTLVVGADLRRPGLGAYLGVSESPGITDVLQRDPGSDPPRVVRSTSIPGLLVLPCGSPVENPAGLLSRERDLILQCRSVADVVVVDTPPLLVANDAVEFLLAADAIILVGRCGLTTRESAQRAAELLRRLKAPVVGVALIGGSGVSPYGYGRYERPGASQTSNAENGTHDLSLAVDANIEAPGEPTEHSGQKNPADESPTRAS